MVLTAPLLLSLMRAFIIFSGQAANHSNQNLQGANHTIKLSWVAVQATKLFCEVSNIGRPHVKII